MKYIHQTVEPNPTEMTMRDEAICWAMLQGMFETLKTKGSVTNGELVYKALGRVQAQINLGVLENFVESNYARDFTMDGETDGA